MPRKPTRPPLSDRLRTALERSGLSQRELARRAGVDQSDISRIARGETDPRASTLERLLDAAGATWADLV